MIQFLAVDLPNVEIGRLTHFNESKDQVYNYSQTFRTPFRRSPKVLIFQTSLEIYSFSSLQVTSQIEIVSKSSEAFQFRLTPQAKTWAGFYIACVDSESYLCDLDSVSAVLDGSLVQQSELQTKV